VYYNIYCPPIPSSNRREQCTRYTHTSRRHRPAWARALSCTYSRVRFRVEHVTACDDHPRILRDDAGALFRTPYKQSLRRRRSYRSELRQSSDINFPYDPFSLRDVEEVGESRSRVGSGGVFVESCDGVSSRGAVQFKGSGRRWRACQWRVYVTRTWRRECGWVPVRRGCVHGGDVLRWNR